MVVLYVVLAFTWPELFWASMVVSFAIVAAAGVVSLHGQWSLWRYRRRQERRS